MLIEILAPISTAEELGIWHWPGHLCGYYNADSHYYSDTSVYMLAVSHRDASYEWVIFQTFAMAFPSYPVTTTFSFLLQFILPIHWHCPFGLVPVRVTNMASWESTPCAWTLLSPDLCSIPTCNTASSKTKQCGQILKEGQDYYCKALTHLRFMYGL